MDALAELLGSDVAAVYIESPNLFGVVEGRGPAIAEAAHAAGALLVVGTDPIALGYLETPARWGADLVCGDIQSLGLGMHFGGANGGFIASPDDERFVFEYPSRLFGLAPTRESGQIGFCDIAYERTSLASREQGNEWVGTAAALWGITAGVYLSLMGPVGLSELGTGVAARTRYAMQQLGQIEYVTVPFADSPHWREFIIRIDKPDVTVGDLSRNLLERGIYGPVDMTEHMNAGQVGLVCVTEQHTQDDIDHFVNEVRSILR
jgi:glycine dehydrogenase subunit 1